MDRKRPKAAKTKESKSPAPVKRTSPLKQWRSVQTRLLRQLDVVIHNIPHQWEGSTLVVSESTCVGKETQFRRLQTLLSLIVNAYEDFSTSIESESESHPTHTLNEQDDQQAVELCEQEVDELLEEENKCLQEYSAPLGESMVPVVQGK